MAAAAVGGMIASGIMKVVIKQIGSASMGKFKRHRSLTKDLEKMKMTLESLEAALSDAERRSITDSAALLWVNRLKDAMYEISDMLNEYDSEDPNLVRTIGKRISMPNKIKKMQDCLQKITEDRKSYSLPPETCTYEMTLPDVRENAGSMIEAEIIGRIKEKSDFLAHLSECCTEGATYGPIWGFGGIGKSKFAKLLFNDSCFKEYSRVWIYVSQMFDLKKIGNTIISQLSEKQDQPLDDLHGISIRLQKLLVEKRNVLIVLDDLWENHPSQLAELKSMLKQGEGCKVIVIVTTRDEGIANEIGTAQPYNLPQFDTRSDKERLEPIGREIAKKCKGVALGAQALGHMLKSKPFREWNWVSTNDIWSLSTSVGRLPRDEVLGSLLLSYNIMPPHLKLCFAYCGIFPKGSKMIKANLIHLWIALEFVEPSSTFSSWQLGEIYIIDRSYRSCSLGIRY